MALLFFVKHYDFCTITDAGDKIKCYRLSKKIRPTSYREYQLQTARINWDKGGIGQKGFPDNNEELRNAIGPYSQILQMGKNSENVLK